MKQSKLYEKHIVRFCSETTAGRKMAGFTEEDRKTRSVRHTDKGMLKDSGTEAKWKE